MQEVLLCFACAAAVHMDHPIASVSMRLVQGKCAMCGRNVWCDLYSEDDVYKGKYERRPTHGQRF